MSTFFKFVLGAKLRELPAQSSLTLGKRAHLFAIVSADAAIPGIPSLSDLSTLDKNSLRCTLHKHDLPCSEKLDCAAICSPAIWQQFKTLPFSYHFITANRILETVGALLSSGLYVWNTRAMHAVCRLLNDRLASSLGSYTSKVGAVESLAKDVVKDPTDVNTTGKKLAVRQIDPQS